MIKHIKCDIFESGADVICHQVNCQGVMGSGVAKQVREKYPWVYATYKRACDNAHNSGSRLLGRAQQVFIDEQRSIMNIFAQDNFGYDGNCYTDYDALRNCLEIIKSQFHNKVIAIPYLLGCYRGGGSWDIVSQMIEEVFANSDCEILICEYNGG